METDFNLNPDNGKKSHRVGLRNHTGGTYKKGKVIIMKNYKEIKKILEERKDRSAWDKGVTVYALEMLENVAESINYDGKEPETKTELKEIAMNGAESWEEYSWGGSALIYNGDIAERLCTPSELKKTRGGERKPNSREEWLDTQTRALYQAFRRLAIAWESANK